jgi:hypothetical protein
MDEPQGWLLTEENKRQNTVALLACATRAIIFVVDMFQHPLLNAIHSQKVFSRQPLHAADQK